MAQHLAQGHLEEAHPVGRVAGDFQDGRVIGTSTSEDMGHDSSHGAQASFPGRRQSRSGFALKLRVESRTELRKALPGSQPKPRSHSPGEFCLALSLFYTGYIYVFWKCFVQMQSDLPASLSEFHVYHQNRKLILCSREHKDLDSC